ERRGSRAGTGHRVCRAGCTHSGPLGGWARLERRGGRWAAPVARL
ncbi:MAG: hypothetical protein AVDCRST_MAG83-2559, partial [uncultured Arthrobacter sp.]